MSTVSDVIDDKDRKIERLQRRVDKLERLLHAIYRDHRLDSVYFWTPHIAKAIGRRRLAQLALEAGNGR